MIRHNLEEFKREVRATVQRLREAWLEGAVDVGVAGYAALLEKTEQTGSVDTGAYRAEHVIQQDGDLLFENPERVGPDQKLPSRKALGQPPLLVAASLDDVRSALETGLRPGPFRFLNQRFYAGQLEHGSARIEPRQIYATAADATAKAAERIATRVSGELRQPR